MSQRCDGRGPFARKSVLPNGVRVLTERLDHVDSASLGLWTISGSRRDPVGCEGITHFVEHMLFKGTATRTALQIGEAIDNVGGYLNGVTDREEMHLYARTSGEHAEASLELLFDLLLHSKCAEEDVAREREVVLQEIAHMRDAAEDWVHELVPQTAWPDHSLGRPLMGSEESVEGIEAASLHRHLTQQMHAPERLILSAAGLVDHDRVAALTEKHTAHLRPVAEQAEEKPPAFHPEGRITSRPGEQVHFCLVSPGIARRDERRHTFAVFDTLLGGGNSSRLFREIRENRGLAYSIGSYLQAYADAGLFVIAAGTSPENFQTVVDLIERETARLHADGPCDEEVTRAKVQLRVALALASENTSFRAQHIALSEIYWGRVLPFEEIAAGVDRASPEEVHDLARQMLGAEERALVAIGPFEGEGGRDE